jgi:excisionase family DNA binding protein
MTKRSRKKAATLAPGSSKVVQAPKAPGPPTAIEITVNGVRIAVSPELEAAVHRAYKGLLQPLPAELTTTQAAEFLDVSRPFVVKLTKRGDLPYRLVGKHRRIPSAALVQYREKMFQRGQEAADEMTRISQELGLYESDAPSRHE